MKQHYRISCPLCGKSSYKKNFDRNNVVKVLIQTFRGRANIKYTNVLDIGVLNEFHRFLVSRIERIYYRLTGIDIQELISNSHQPLTTKILPSCIPSTINPSIDTTVHSPIDVAVYPKSTAKIKPYKVVVI